MSSGRKSIGVILFEAGRQNNPEVRDFLTAGRLPTRDNIKLSRRGFRTSAHFPKVVRHHSTHFHELRKVMGTSKLMIPVPLFDLKSLEMTCGKQCRDFRSAD
jgi:hypothetical protein